MNTIYPIKKLSIAFLICVSIFSACKKDKYTFGDIKAPENLSVNISIDGADTSNPAGIGSGKITITVAATNAISYFVDFGDGVTKELSGAPTIYKYKTPGTKTYQIKVNAIGTGGVTTTTVTSATVFVAFEIPANILQFLTNGSSRTWVTAKEEPGHFGVGPKTGFSPDWYSAPPNGRDACAYDDEITFSKDAQNNVAMEINSKGEFFSIEAATAYYGFSGKDGCYAINSGGKKNLAFMDASSGSTPDVSTGVQFIVPGNGIINFGTGGTDYEILSISNNLIHLRNIGVDGNAWYMKLTPKP
ncbi:MAG: hypothetical protein CFE21_04265 [Bacteroidetes bacterium B1(2017)]|nr:MAG: hypothetical protein CFE21_04265 [Bacteroidetes bacterium B1(2017)]